MHFVIVVTCLWCRSCFVASIVRMSMAAFLGYPAGQPLLGLGAETRELVEGPDIVHMTLVMLTSTLTCGVLLQTGTRIKAAEKTRAWVKFRNVIEQPPQVVPVRYALMTPSTCNLGRNFFMGCLKFSIRSKCTPM